MITDFEKRANDSIAYLCTCNKFRMTNESYNRMIIECMWTRKRNEKESMVGSAVALVLASFVCHFLWCAIKYTRQIARADGLALINICFYVRFHICLGFAPCIWFRFIAYARFTVVCSRAKRHTIPFCQSLEINLNMRFALNHCFHFQLTTELKPMTKFAPYFCR